MNKKMIALVLGVIALAALGVWGGYYFATQKDIFSPLPLQESPEGGKATLSATNKEYIDDSGFQFAYPDNLALSRKDVTDNTVYTYIQITSQDQHGSILIRAYDDKAPSLDAWIGGNKKLSAFVDSAKDITFAGLAGRQIKTNDSVVTAALDQGVLFTIEVFAQNNEAYWMSASNRIIESFAFSSSEPTASAQSSTASQSTSGGSDASVIFEGEETVE